MFVIDAVVEPSFGAGWLSLRLCNGAFLGTSCSLSASWCRCKI